MKRYGKADIYNGKCKDTANDFINAFPLLYVIESDNKHNTDADDDYDAFQPCRLCA